MHLDNPNANPSSANYRYFFAELCAGLPEYPGEDPEAQAQRQQRAMNAFVDLVPHDHFEGRLALRIVSADAQAADALRSAASAVAAGNDEKVRQCRAQAASMARTSDCALRTLLRMQAKREKQLAEMHPAAMEKAGYWFKSVEVPPAPSQDPPQPPTPPDAEPVHTQAQIDADAKLYEIMYPDRVARIRAAGGLPPRLDFGPPEPEIVAALLRRAGHAQGAQSHRSRQ